jgi:hypothetical protein
MCKFQCIQMSPLDNRNINLSRTSY